MKLFVVWFIKRKCKIKSILSNLEEDLVVSWHFYKIESGIGLKISDKSLVPPVSPRAVKYRMMPIDLYYTMGSTPCHAVLLLTKYMGLDVNLKTINLDKSHVIDKDIEEFLKVTAAINCINSFKFYNMFKR